LNALGIAPYKLYFDDAQREIRWLAQLGFEVVHQRVEAGDLESMIDEYDAVFLGVGLGGDKFLQSEYKNISGVTGACELIVRIKSDEGFSLGDIKNAYVMGGGNTAIDIAHELKLLGVDSVKMLYRQGRAKMSGYRHEVDAALRDGVVLIENAELEDIEDGCNKLSGISYCRKYGESEEIIADSCDLLVFAIGQEKNKLVANNPKLFSGGDCVNGGKEVVDAVAHAKLAFDGIMKLFGATRA